MLNLFIRTTERKPDLPRWYVTYYQELEPPFRHAARCLVVGVGAKDWVIGRWTDAWDDEDMANRVAIGARPVRPWWDTSDAGGTLFDEPDDGSAGCLVA